MRRAQMVLAAWLALSSAGCVLRGKQQANATTPPPAPAPAVRPAAATPRPQPLSIPQTQAQLPPPQPISPEAMATLQQAPPPVETPAEPRAPRRAAGPVAAPARAETPPVQAQTPPVVAPAEAEPRPTVQEIVAPAELKRLQESADGRKQEIRKVLEQAQARGLNRDQREMVTRIQSFVQLSDEAEKRGDMRQADALAERGQLLMRELQNGGR
ncbi:MAG TPA: hypothetical protein VLY24_17380 [Bryobacteraceae bacterium]|nr:hypothetical protein [Bryobacteraceae bacterium]